MFYLHLLYSVVLFVLCVYIVYICHSGFYRCGGISHQNHLIHCVAMLLVGRIQRSKCDRTVANVLAFSVIFFRRNFRSDRACNFGITRITAVL